MPHSDPLAPAQLAALREAVDVLTNYISPATLWQAVDVSMLTSPDSECESVATILNAAPTLVALAEQAAARHQPVVRRGRPSIHPDDLKISDHEYQPWVGDMTERCRYSWRCESDRIYCERRASEHVQAGR